MITAVASAIRVPWLVMLGWRMSGPQHRARAHQAADHGVDGGERQPRRDRCAERVALDLRRGERGHHEIGDDRAGEQRQADALVLLDDTRAGDAAREGEHEQRTVHGAEYYPVASSG